MPKTKHISPPAAPPSRKNSEQFFIASRKQPGSVQTGYPATSPVFTTVQRDADKKILLRQAVLTNFLMDDFWHI